MRLDASTRRILLWLFGLGLAGGVLVVAMAQLPLFAWMETAIEQLQLLGPLAVAAFAVVHIACIVAFVPVSPFVFAAGIVWGTAGGTAIITLDNLIGPTIAFFLARRWLRPTVQRLVRGNKHAEAIDRAMALGGFRAVILLRLSPIVPMSILNYGLGLFELRTGTYVVATAVGLLPITVLYCWGGAGIGEISALASGDIDAGPVEQVLFWAGLAATFGAVWYLERLARRALREVEGRGA